jgi:hypothetical protein
MDAAIGGITKGFDALVYTDEEKAGDAAKERSEARSMIVDWMKEHTGPEHCSTIDSIDYHNSLAD